jgi:hypothetical protein
MANERKRLSLPDYLFWDMDTTRLDMEYSYQLVIERVIQLGTLEQWRDAQQYYGKERFLEVAAASKQISQRERQFTELFTQSAFHVAP